MTFSSSFYSHSDSPSSFLPVVLPFVAGCFTSTVSLSLFRYYKNYNKSAPSSREASKDDNIDDGEIIRTQRISSKEKHAKNGEVDEDCSDDEKNKRNIKEDEEREKAEGEDDSSSNNDVISNKRIKRSSILALKEISIGAVEDIRSRIGELPSLRKYPHWPWETRGRWPWETTEEESKSTTHTGATTANSGDKTSTINSPLKRASQQKKASFSPGMQNLANAANTLEDNNTVKGIKRSATQNSNNNNNKKSDLCIGSIFGLDVGGTLSKLVYFEKGKTESFTEHHRERLYRNAASARAVLLARRGATNNWRTNAVRTTIAGHGAGGLDLEHESDDEFLVERKMRSASVSGIPFQPRASFRKKGTTQDQNGPQSISPVCHSAASNKDLRGLYDLRQESVPDDLHAYANSFSADASPSSGSLEMGADSSFILAPLLYDDDEEASRYHSEDSSPHLSETRRSRSSGALNTLLSCDSNNEEHDAKNRSNSLGGDDANQKDGNCEVSRSTSGYLSDDHSPQATRQRQRRPNRNIMPRKMATAVFRDSNKSNNSDNANKFRRSRSMFDMSKSHAEAMDNFYEFARRLESYSEGVKDSDLSFFSRELGGHIHFIRFETRSMHAAMDLIRSNQLHLNIHKMGATGGGAHKFAAEFQAELGIEMQKHDELGSLVIGMQFCLSTIVGECYTFRPTKNKNASPKDADSNPSERQGPPSPPSLDSDIKNNTEHVSESKKSFLPLPSRKASDYDDNVGTPYSDSEDEADTGYSSSEHSDANNNESGEDNDEPSESKANKDAKQGDEWWWSRKVKRDDIVVDSSTYPYLLVSIGTGVSILRVDGPGRYERISGSTIGGGTYWGLIRLLTDVEDFEGVMRLAERGDPSKVDMMVGDIYGKNSDALEKLGLPASLIASSFGKLVAKEDPAAGLKQEDLARALLLMVTTNIGQVAYLNAKLANTRRLYFVGNFLRGNRISQRRLSFSVDYWSKGDMEALFLEHEGYFGALGAFLKSQDLPPDFFSDVRNRPAAVAAMSSNKKMRSSGSSESTTRHRRSQTNIDGPYACIDGDNR